MTLILLYLDIIFGYYLLSFKNWQSIQFLLTMFFNVHLFRHYHFFCYSIPTVNEDYLLILRTPIIYLSLIFTLIFLSVELHLGCWLSPVVFGLPARFFLPVGLFQDYNYFPLLSCNWYQVTKGNNRTASW